ncbi:unnamed protein product [Dimorphilus gyrociliatus]|uniref:Uncharacterized protein n=1 Tax=Dimorphilus gyrociliatus TaxID=2664684 RepID=A0A7I8WB84_9ANNE|nr:unnamed protein product [Dimorphilus gyrociliatus]
MNSAMFEVDYLGSSSSLGIGTGVGALQKPLKVLYTTYVQKQSASKIPNMKTLSLSEMGLTLSENGNDIHFNMDNIILWDVVQFVMLKDKKKTRIAFEPLDTEQNINMKDNLFTVIDKKEVTMFSKVSNHPAILAFVARRPAGIKSLDVHAFICGSDNDAKEVHDMLNQLNLSRQSNNREKGVFSYNPYDDMAAAGSVKSVTAVVTPRARSVRMKSSLSTSCIKLTQDVFNPIEDDFYTNRIEKNEIEFQQKAFEFKDDQYANEEDTTYCNLPTPDQAVFISTLAAQEAIRRKREKASYPKPRSSSPGYEKTLPIPKSSPPPVSIRVHNAKDKPVAKVTPRIGVKVLPKMQTTEKKTTNTMGITESMSALIVNDDSIKPSSQTNFEKCLGYLP